MVRRSRKNIGLFTAGLFVIYVAGTLAFYSTAFGRASRRTVEPDPTPSASVSPSAEPTPPVLPYGEGIHFECENCGSEEAAMVPRMQELLHKVVKTQCFEDRFVKTQYRSQLVQTYGLSRKEVVERIRTAQILVPLFFYTPTLFQSKTVVGYTTTGVDTVYLNRSVRRYSDWTLCSEVSNALHEATHKMIRENDEIVGFDHDFKSTSRRPYSVPYTANYAVDSCCDVFLSGQSK